MFYQATIGTLLKIDRDKRLTILTLIATPSWRAAAIWRAAAPTDKVIVVADIGPLPPTLPTTLAAFAVGPESVI